MVEEETLDFRADRDATLKLIDWFDIDRARTSKVLVVGAGAIGNEALKNLALLGVGHIYIFDRDTIEMSNLSRSVLYTGADMGQSKAHTAARRLREINASVRTYWNDGDIYSDLGEGLIRRMDAVIGCLDNMNARLLLNRLCWRVGKPWIDAGIGSLNGHVRVFHPPNGPCYECALPEDHDRRQAVGESCRVIARRQVDQGRIPTTPTIASIVGAVQVQECLKLLDAKRWEGRSLAGRQFDFYGEFAAADVTGLPAREGCLVHDETIDPHLIVEMPKAHSQMTAAALMVAAKRVLPDAYLVLPDEVAVEWRCRLCGAAYPLLRPLPSLYQGDLICESCGHEPTWESEIKLTHKVSANHSPRALLEATLRALGVPRFGLVEARGSNGEVRFLELTGDANQSVIAEPPPVSRTGDSVL
ncbi:MAG: ThiF family adenylyltransferase [Acidobacteria bacterium]|nr:ThiF family adenylyltransferase [Acidobacteriota bacterium]